MHSVESLGLRDVSLLYLWILARGVDQGTPMGVILLFVHRFMITEKFEGLFAYRVSYFINILSNSKRVY